MAQLTPGTSILIVDDDPAVRMMLETMTREAGYHVVGASGPEEIVDALQRFHFDLVITDMIMPEMDGTEVIKAARTHQPYAGVIVMSGGGQRLSPELCLKIGTSTSRGIPLPKPFGAPALLSAIERALSTRETRGLNVARVLKTPTL